MPYKNRDELPESVKDNLPKHAQEVYQEAFNSTWDIYENRETTAHKVAWSAVKNSYSKNEQGNWVKLNN